MRTATVRMTWAALALVLTLSSAIAQERPPITPADYGQWETLGMSSLSPDGQWLAYAINRQNDENELRVHDVRADTTGVVPYGARPIFSSDSRWLAYGIGHSERERRRNSGTPLRMKLGLADLSSGTIDVIDEVADYSFSADGAYLAMRRYAPRERDSRGADLIVRDLGTGTDTNFGNVAAFSWSDEDALLALTIDAEGPWAQVDFDPTGPRIALSGSDGVAEIWDVESGERLAVLAGPPGGVKGLAFSPDGSRIAAASVDGLVRLFDAETGAPELRLRGSGCAVEGVAFSPDGRKLASTSWCDGVRVWALDIDDLLEIARREAGRSLTDEECRQYLHVDECSQA
jgi:Tol biopolymer transport system component